MYQHSHYRNPRRRRERRGWKKYTWNYHWRLPKPKQGFIYQAKGSTIFCCVFSVVSDSATPWTVACQDPLSMEFSRQACWGVGCYFSLQGIFQIQGLNPHLASPALAGRFFTTAPPGKLKGSWGFQTRWTLTDSHQDVSYLKLQKLKSEFQKQQGKNKETAIRLLANFSVEILQARRDGMIH